MSTNQNNVSSGIISLTSKLTLENNSNKHEPSTASKYKQKSASTEFLNHIANNASQKPSILPNIDDAEIGNTAHANTPGSIRSILKQQQHEPKPTVSPPPPQIQPFSGVLSKSLFSLVHKPQPIKPAASRKSIRSPALNARPAGLRHDEANLRTHGNAFKKKCQSTTNLTIHDSKRK